MREPFVVLKEVYLRALERADLPSLVKWINDAEVTRLLFMGDRPATVERLTEQWETEQRGGKDIPFAVCARKGDALLGTTGLYSIQWIMRTAEFRIFLGDKRYWNRGIGTAVTKAMATYGFEKLNLNRVYLGVNAENKGGVKAYENAGFKREGILREEQYRNFRYYDVIRMGQLRREYETMRQKDARPG